jgi:acyl-CoA synthetase (AMP-forming)/AMP-acid ligase II
VLLPNGPDWVGAWLAATRIGCVAVPINTFYKPRDLAAYKIPRHVVFAAKTELPFADSGKIDKRRLVGLLAARRRRGAGM